MPNCDSNGGTWPHHQPCLRLFFYSGTKRTIGLPNRDTAKEKIGRDCLYKRAGSDGSSFRQASCGGLSVVE